MYIRRSVEMEGNGGEKVAKIKRSMLRGAVGDIRGSELELPRRGRRGLGVGRGVGWEDEAGLSADGSSTFHGG